MSKRRHKSETPWQRLGRVVVPGTTGGVYTLIPGAISFFVVVGLFVHSYFSSTPMPNVTGELLTASLGLMGLHTLRGASADRVNAANSFESDSCDRTATTLRGAMPPSPLQAARPQLPDLRPSER